MLKLPADARLFMAVAPVDMRRSFSGLCAIITETLGANPVGGDLLLIVSKFACGLPLYRIAGRLARLGIELSHTLMSEWLVQCAELLEELHGRMVRKVLDSGHVYSEDTTLPLQNHDPARRKTYEAKLWVYAKDDRHGPPLIVYEFSKSRTRDAPLTFLKDYRGTCRPMPIRVTTRFTSTGRSRKSLATCMRADASWRRSIC